MPLNDKGKSKVRDYLIYIQKISKILELIEDDFEIKKSYPESELRVIINKMKTEFGNQLLNECDEIKLKVSHDSITLGETFKKILILVGHFFRDHNYGEFKEYLLKLLEEANVELSRSGLDKIDEYIKDPFKCIELKKKHFKNIERLNSKTINEYIEANKQKEVSITCKETSFENTFLDDYYDLKFSGSLNSNQGSSLLQIAEHKLNNASAAISANLVSKISGGSAENFDGRLREMQVYVSDFARDLNEQLAQFGCTLNMEGEGYLHLYLLCYITKYSITELCRKRQSFVDVIVSKKDFYQKQYEAIIKDKKEDYPKIFYEYLIDEYKKSIKSQLQEKYKPVSYTHLTLPTKRIV